MRLAFAFLAVIILLCGCSGNPQGDEEKVDPVTTFARMEVGDERNMVWMDLDNMVWKAGLTVSRFRKQAEAQVQLSQRTFTVTRNFSFHWIFRECSQFRKIPRF